jgi:PAS domain S-box-containing protein/putative nucleotidyltransferase with HDIG domain
LQSQEDLSRLKQTEAILQQERDFISAVIETIGALILVVDTEGHIIRFNRACEELSGYTFAEVKGQNALDLLLAPEEAAEVNAHFAKTVAGDFPNRRENHWVTKDGTRRLIAWSNTALLDSKGQVEYVVGTGIDITERRRQEEDKSRLHAETVEQRHRLDTLLATVPGVVWESWSEHETDQHVDFVSEQVETMLGYSVTEWLETPNFWLTIVHPDDKERAAREGAEILAGERHTVVQYRWVTKDGRIIWCESHMAVIRNEAGQPLGIRGVTLDITKRKQAQTALHESEMRLQALVASIDEIVFEFDYQSGYVNIWARDEALLLKPRNQLLGHTITEVMGEALAQPFVEAIRRVMESKQAESLEYSLPVGGEQHWFLSRLSPILAPDGSCGSVCMLSRDITERRRMEDRLRHLSQAVEQSPTSVMITDTSGNIEYVNAKFCELTGYNAEEVLGRNPRLLKSGGTSPDEYRRLWQTISSGGVWRGELHNRKKNGDLYWELASMSAMRDAAGNITHYLALKEDISERKQREAELEAIASMTAVLRQATSAEQMFPLILSQVQTLIRAEGGLLVLRDLESGDNVVQFADGAWTAANGLRLKAGEGLVSQVMASRQPFSTDNLQETPALVRRDLLGDLSAAAIVPLFTHRQTIGALFVGRSHAFTESEIRVLQSMSEIAANAIHRATLHEQTQQRLQQLNALRTIDMAISASLDLRVTMHVVLDELMTQLEADAVCVLLLNEEDQTLHYAEGRGLDARWMERRFLRVGQHLAGQAALKRRLVRVLDLAAHTQGEDRDLLPPNHGFKVYYGVPLVSKGRVQGVLEVYRRTPQAPGKDWESFLEALAGQASIAVDNAGLFEDLQRSNVELTLAYDSTIEGWSKALDLRDKETEGHSLRVTEGTLQLARAMGVPAAELVQVRRGALLHDIGKMGIPDSILLKPGKLTDEEWVVMRKHPVFAYELLYPIAFLRPALDIPYCHHEKWDGTGYPRGLKGDQIPLSARIFAVIDVWDALRSNRPYREGWPPQKVREHIRAGSGSHFDPQVVEFFLSLPEHAKTRGVI